MAKRQLVCKSRLGTYAPPDAVDHPRMTSSLYRGERASYAANSTKLSSSNIEVIAFN